VLQRKNMCMHYADALLFTRTILYEQKNVKLILYPMFARRQYTCSKTLELNRFCLLTQVKCVSSILQRVKEKELKYCMPQLNQHFVVTFFTIWLLLARQK
jgi:hypothetical protein